MPPKRNRKEYMKKYNMENKDKIKEERKQYREAHKEKKKEYDKKYHIENKDKIKEYNKKYKEANKDKVKEVRKEYTEANKDKIKEYDKEYRKTEIGKKNSIINNWLNRSKIKFVDRNEAEFYYETYINTHRCTWCNIEFKNSSDRQLDHCHICSLPRAIICRSCNKQDLVPCVNCLL